MVSYEIGMTIGGVESVPRLDCSLPCPCSLVRLWQLPDRDPSSWMLLDSTCKDQPSKTRERRSLDPEWNGRLTLRTFL